jgi:predicted nuclease of restriction endonuclease-like (RecB) superfamily
MEVTMLLNTKEYLNLVEQIKQDIAASQRNAILSANNELVMLHWRVGCHINEHKSWGGKFIENLARDIRADFPNLKGFSGRNLKYMSKFAGLFDNLEIVQQPVAQLPWKHNIVLMDKVKSREEMAWYAGQAIECGWSSNILIVQIERKLYERQALANKTTNFAERLPAPQSEMVQQAMKDSYIFDFVENHRGMVERDLENGLTEHITKFLLELGSGFAFVGRQYHLEVGGQDFYIDLLFYNLKLRCYVVVELKMKEFKPEYAGKLNFYVSAVDGELRQPMDNPTIGILLCKSKNKVIAEYALRDINKPIGVGEFELLDKLPKEFEDILPTAEDIESRLSLSDGRQDSEGEE